MYELELETDKIIEFFHYPHNRKGLLAALKCVYKNRAKLIVANIRSHRDGLIYNFCKNNFV